MLETSVSIASIEKTFRSALRNGMIREEDTVVIFHDLTFLRERTNCLRSCFPRSTLHAAAVKANPLARILDFIKPLGMGIEAATTGEIHLALKSGYPPSMIVFDSPVKTCSDLEFALNTGVYLNVDNLSELQRIAKILSLKRSESKIGIRINPQVGMGSIAESSVAGEYSKFGVPVKHKRKELRDAFMTYPWLTGVHLHVGSQGCPMELLLNGIGILYDFVADLNPMRIKAGLAPVSVFDIGGGLPISYNRDMKTPSLEEYATEIQKKFPELFTDHFSLITEFGRWLFVNGGWTASRVEYVKSDPGINTAMIHVGADLFVRECLNPKDWSHEYSLLNSAGSLKSGTDDHPYNLAGPLCFSGDILAKAVNLPSVSEGDYLIVHDTGGYTFSMWSRYNSRQTPRIIGYFSDGEEFLILKERESLDDIEKFWR